MTAAPEIFVLAGPNGAGKSTVAEVVLPRRLSVGAFVNADLIAKGMTPHDPDASAIAAGREMLRRIRALRDAGETFAFETTLASRSFAPFLRDAQRRGYRVYLVYVALDDADLAVDRVRLRVERGGHSIEEAVIRRRFTRSKTNFFDLYRPLVDAWIVWDNTGRGPVEIARGVGDREGVILDFGRWRAWTEAHRRR